MPASLGKMIEAIVLTVLTVACAATIARVLTYERRIDSRDASRLTANAK